MEKKFNGKAIYNPSGKAAEYSKWACNFYVGCSNGCIYCYCKKGILAGAMGGNIPTLKKCFKDENHALEVFEKELQANLPELQKHGLFFSFTSDPLLYETYKLTYKAVYKCIENNICVKVLTKSVKYIDSIKTLLLFILDKSNWLKVAFGFTLTGHDELEPNTSTNAERIEAMQKLHDAGFKTWASIEPVIDFESSLQMIEESLVCCNHYKIGLESGKKYDKLRLRIFVEKVICMKTNNSIPTLYFKDSLLKAVGINREDLPENCVGRDYNMFNQ
jgi:DNA repair photolyase